MALGFVKSERASKPSLQALGEPQSHGEQNNEIPADEQKN
jgi:hypothetical protein